MGEKKGKKAGGSSEDYEEISGENVKIEQSEYKME